MLLSGSEGVFNRAAQNAAAAIGDKNSNVFQIIEDLLPGRTAPAPQTFTFPRTLPHTLQWPDRIGGLNLSGPQMICAKPDAYAFPHITAPRR